MSLPRDTIASATAFDSAQNPNAVDETATSSIFYDQAYDVNNPGMATVANNGELVTDMGTGTGVVTGNGTGVVLDTSTGVVPDTSTRVVTDTSTGMVTDSSTGDTVAGVNDTQYAISGDLSKYAIFPEFDSAFEIPLAAATTVDSAVPPPGDGTVPATNDGTTPVTDGTNGPTGSLLRPEDVQTLTALWANANGMNPNDAQSYSMVTAGQDGTLAVGPYQMDAGLIGQWFSSSGAMDANGNMDQNVIAQLVQSGKISQTTATAISSPEFMTFMNGVATGQKPTPEQVAQFLTPDLQQTIASDLTSYMAEAVNAQTGQLDPGQIVASLKLRQPVTQEQLSDPQISQFIASVNASLSGAPAETQVDPNATTDRGVVPNTTDTGVVPNTTDTKVDPNATTPLDPTGMSQDPAETGEGPYIQINP